MIKMNESLPLCVDINLIVMLGEKLNAPRKNGEFCDFSIKSKDGETIPVHKHVLRSISPFFEKMLDSGMIECRQDFVILEKFSSENLERIIEYMYTGNILVPLENATEILDAALFLGLNYLVEFCTTVLIDRIKKDNVWRLFEYSRTLVTDDLTRACADWIIKNIESIDILDGVENISLESIRMLLQRKRDYDCCEDKYHTLILKWIEFEEETRRAYTTELIDYLNFDFFSKEYIKCEIARTAKFIDDTKYLVTFVEKCLKFEARSIAKPQQNLSVCTSNEQLYVVTYENIYKIDLDIKNDRSPHLKKSHSLHWMLNDISILGSLKRLLITTFSYFDFPNLSPPLVLEFRPMMEQKFGAKSDCVPITFNFFEGKTFFFKGFVVIYNGREHEILFENNQWLYSGAKLEYMRSACVLNNNLYACTISGLYCFDEKRMSWECLAKYTIISDFRELEIIGYKDYLYHFTDGGYFIYDTKINQYLSDFIDYEYLEKEKSLIKTIFGKNDTCMYNKRNDVYIRLKPFKESMLKSISSVCLFNNKFYFYNYDNKKVIVYNASSMDFYQEFPLELPENERFRCLININSDIFMD